MIMNKQIVKLTIERLFKCVRWT